MKRELNETSQICIYIFKSMDSGVHTFNGFGANFVHCSFNQKCDLERHPQDEPGRIFDNLFLFYFLNSYIRASFFRAEMNFFEKNLTFFLSHLGER